MDVVLVCVTWAVADVAQTVCPGSLHRIITWLGLVVYFRLTICRGISWGMF